MADDLNALINVGRVPTLQSGDTVQVNPLAAMTSAAQTAGTIFDARAKQGQGLWGQALQQSTDPTTGVVDYQKANRIAATMGPAAAQVAGVNLGNNSNLTGAQLEQAVARNGFVGNLAASGMNDASDGNWDKIRAQAVAANLPPSALAEIDRIRALPQEQRGAEAYKHVLGKMDALSQMARGGYPAPTTVTAGTSVVPAEVTPGSPYGPTTMRQGQGSIQLGLTPDELNAQSPIKDPRRTLPDGSPNGSPNPDYAKPKLFTRREQLEMNGFTIGPNGEVYPPGQAPPGQGGISGTGRYNIPPAISGNQPAPAAPAGVVHGNPATPQAVPAPPGGPPGASPAPYTGPGMGGVLPAPAPRPGASLQGGVPVASSTNALQPNVGQPGPPSPAVPGDVAAILAGMNQARGTPVAGTMGAGPAAQMPQGGFGTDVGSYGGSTARTPPPAAATSPFNRPAVGLSPREETQTGTAGAKFDAETTAGTQAQAQQALLSNMLVDTKQFLPGPWAETWKNIRARLAPAFNVNETALAGAENFDKAAAQLANAQGAGSDSRMSVNIAANPHGGMSAPGVDLALRQLQGNADYLQARAKLAQQWPNSDHDGFASSVRQLDPRVFQYERMTDNQKQDYFKALEPKDRAAFKTAHGWAEQRGLVAPPGS